MMSGAAFDDDDDEDEDFFEGIYVDGHWEWDNANEALCFVSDLVSTEDSLLAYIMGPIEFKDDIDLIEQQRFKKRFQRKPEGSDDVVTLQDVKDLVLFIAPLTILTDSVINILHLNTTERFLRALIAYCQYYLQISYEMARRVLELEKKIPTSLGKEKENVYRNNLQDLRLLVAKEYCTMVLGGADFKNYHHMSTLQMSLTRKDSITFESFIKLCVHIVWIALGRKMHNVIDSEVHRLFKSQKFNMVEHKSGNNTLSSMSSSERHVLIGTNVRDAHSLKTRSPLINEIITTGNLVDYRYLALGLLKQHRLCHRLVYMERVLILSEIHLMNHNMTLGIIGLKRARFDTMLREVRNAAPGTSNSTTSFTQQQARRASKMSRMSNTSRKSATTAPSMHLLYPDMVIPPKHDPGSTLPDFPVERVPSSVWCHNKQREKWLARRTRLLATKRAARETRRSTRLSQSNPAKEQVKRHKYSEQEN